ncbi:MAG: helix-turn-helix domain-containing protein [Bdellovibrionales bacterium]|nr:helix-turn-helix domain-containing protein [Bdellovibrionales bacterium]
MKITEIRLLTYDDIHRIIGGTKGAIYSLVHRNAIPHIRITSRIVRFHPEEIARWLEFNGMNWDPEHGVKEQQSET